MPLQLLSNTNCWLGLLNIYDKTLIAIDLTTRHSFSGFCFLLASAGVVYKSKQQLVIATSATKAEFI
jgi:hypothetical protein